MYSYLMVKQVMLAAKFDKNPIIAQEQMKQIRFPVYLSTKIDGIRAHAYKGQLFSRKNLLIPNLHVQSLFSDLNGLDGELVCGIPNSKECFNFTQSGVMTRAGYPQVTYHIFDHVDMTRDHPFEQRIELAKKKIASYRNPLLKPVTHTMVYNLEELEEFRRVTMLDGWEGVMIRGVASPYKQGRSTLREGWLIKLKSFQDSEAVILGCYEQETNNNEATINEVGRSKRSSHKENKVRNGHLGGFIVRDSYSGVEFNVGNFDGVTQEERKTMWQSYTENIHYFDGKIIRYRYFPVGVKDKPRHPTFTGFRSPIDI